MRLKPKGRMAVLAVCVERRGYRAGSRVAQLVWEWELVVRDKKGPITCDEFAVWWKIGHATAFRRLAEFRETFPELGPRAFPHDLMVPLVKRLQAGEDVPDDFQLAVPA